MKLLILCVLAVIGAVFTASARARANLNVGFVGDNDRLLDRTYLYKAAIPNATLSQDVIYRGNATIKITAVQATEVGYTQYAYAYIISGGLGQNNVSVRVQSARGYGYYYLVDIWGR